MALKVVKVRETARPGNRMVVCLSRQFKIGKNIRFRQNVPTEVTQEQFDYLISMNAKVGKIIFREYTAKILPKAAPVSNKEAVENLFAELPKVEKKQISKVSEVFPEEETEEIDEEPENEELEEKEPEKEIDEEIDEEPEEEEPEKVKLQPKKPAARKAGKAMIIKEENPLPTDEPESSEDPLAIKVPKKKPVLPVKAVKLSGKGRK